MKYVAVVGAACGYYCRPVVDHCLVEYAVWFEHRLHGVDLFECYVVKPCYLRWFECCDS